MDRAELERVLNQASSHWLENKPKECQAVLEEALPGTSTWPYNGYVLHGLTAVLAPTMADPDRVVTLSEEFLHIRDGNHVLLRKCAEAYFRYGVALRVLGRYQEAVSVYQIAAAVFGAMKRDERFYAHCNMAWAATLGGDYETAVRALDAATVFLEARDNSDVDSYQRDIARAFMLARVGQTDQAEALCSELLHSYGEISNDVRVQAYWVLGDIAISRCDADAAAQYIQQGRELAGDDHRLLNDFASLEAAIQGA